VGETPEVWIGRDVLLHIWKSDGLGTEPHEAISQGIDSFGVTVEGSQQGPLTFCPWSTVREIVLRQDQASG
jgi:hypothetical protein